MSVLWQSLVVVLCCAVAHVLPQETFYFAYAFLGPAHYLTEISYLHDKGYFVKNPLWFGTLAFLACYGTMFLGGTWGSDAVLLAFGSGAFAGCFASQQGMKPPFVVAISTVASIMGALVAFWAVRYGWKPVLAFAILVPTLIHVAGFTALFVAGGAIRRSGTREIWILAVLVMSVLSFAVLPVFDLGRGAGSDFLLSSFAKLCALLGIRDVGASGAIVGFLGFVYLYHYVNWFMKTGLIGWHRVSRTRLFLISSAWIIMTGCWIIKPEVGLFVSLPLSLCHVFLEFPLNAMSIRQVTGGLWTRMTRARRVSGL